MAAIDTKRDSRFRTGVVLPISAAHFVHDIFTALIAPLLPLLIQKFSLSLTQAGSLVFIMQLPSLLNPILGSLTDRYKLHRSLVVIAPGVTGTLVCLMGLAPGYAGLVVLLLTAGFSVAGIHVGAPVLIKANAGDAVGRGMSFFMVAGELARTVGPLVAVQLAASFGVGGLWRVIPVAVASSLLLWWRLGSVPEYEPEGQPSQLFAVWRSMRRIFAALVGILVARAFMGAALTTYLPTFIYGEGHSLWLANISLSVLELAGAAGALTAGTLSDFLGRRRVLTWAVLLGPPLMLLFLFAGGPLRLIVLVALGFVTLSTTPVLLAVMIENSGANPAAATGTFMMISFAIRGLIILIVGGAGDLFGLQAAFVGCAILAVFGLPFVFLLPQDRRRV
ncbi:MAG: MFS transporter [Candidatus Latescibacterota bacterium]|nr:MAG: MFS transporter [Candidatus Latescibacterota bacterium]